MSNMHRVQHDDPKAIEMSDLVLEMHEVVVDKIHASQYRRKTRTVEDAFLVVAGHVAYAIAARRQGLNGTPLPMLISDICAVIEMNAMEMFTSNQGEK